MKTFVHPKPGMQAYVVLHSCNPNSFVGGMGTISEELQFKANIGKRLVKTHLN
jgi:hypothetical protein